MTENKESNKATSSLTIIRDPAMAMKRIFIGNLPVCTREELESICQPYGDVLSSLVQKNFGFVQFESEEIANKAAQALTKSTFKGNTITVRNAGVKKAVKKPAETNVSVVADRNDCEIIVVDRANTKYAEYIEGRLKRLNLRVDVLFPNADVPLGKVLTNISLRGCLYAILVTNQHQEHNSITVNILYDQPAEHRNMPVEDAIKLIAEDFRSKVARDGLQNNVNTASMGQLPSSVSIAAAGMLAPPLKERHPDAIQVLLNLLTDNMQLTVLQYDKIIKYMQERRELQLQAELGETAAIVEKPPDPEIELQKKILNILNKPSVAETHYELLYPTLKEVKEDYRLLELLRDIRVQKALDSLMDSNLVTTIENYMKF